MNLESVVTDIADGLVKIDSARTAFKQFLPGVGPFGEPQLLRLVAEHLNSLTPYAGTVKIRRTPDLLIPGHWALECKLARPFGDNGKPAENWSVNLLHPYAGNVSMVGDCLKLRLFQCNEHKAVVVIGYEHTPPKISLDFSLCAFEMIATMVLDIHLGRRVQTNRAGLIHPVHQQLVVAAWEVLP